MKRNGLRKKRIRRIGNATDWRHTTLWNGRPKTRSPKSGWLTMLGGAFNMYRPQFPYPPTPPSCQDQRCTYSFDGSNTPLLSGTLAAGGQTGRIPLLLDRDADF